MEVGGGAGLEMVFEERGKERKSAFTPLYGRTTGLGAERSCRPS